VTSYNLASLLEGSAEKYADRDAIVFGETRLAYAQVNRSEEHTSELQSPVPNSYAVFCLKKKTVNNICLDVR